MQKPISLDKKIEVIRLYESQEYPTMKKIAETLGISASAVGDIVNLWYTDKFGLTQGDIPKMERDVEWLKERL